MAGLAPDSIAVRHFGSRVGVPGGGGIASVIAMHAELPYTVARPTFVTTAHLGARLHSAQHLPGAVWALLRMRLARRPQVVHVHLAGGGSLVREGGVVRLARRLGLPTVVTVHASDLAEAASDHRARLRAVLHAAHVVHALGAASEAILRDVGGPGVEIAVIPNCVASPAVVTDAGDNPPIAVFAGEQSLRKGVDVLLAAWPAVRRAVPDAELVIAGNRRDVMVVPTAGVQLIGAVSRQRVAAELSRARVAVLPSRNETQPMFLLEAMAAARPVVATTIAEIPRTVADPTGLVAPGDVGALTDALVVFLTDRDRATRSGHLGREHTLRTRSPAEIAVRFETIYARVVELADVSGRSVRRGVATPPAELTR